MQQPVVVMKSGAMVKNDESHRALDNNSDVEELITNIYSCMNHEN